VSQLYMLDTNMASYLLKGKSPAARDRMRSLHAGETACISVVTEAEMLYGIAKTGMGEQRLKILNWFLLLVAIRPWRREEAAVYGRLRARQEAMGKTLGPLDMQIAAQAISLGAILVTNDRAFHQVPDLAGVENWATDL
jgi:tRNA(fMet)-specific endonuclease VapC